MIVAFGPMVLKKLDIKPPVLASPKIELTVPKIEIPKLEVPILNIEAFKDKKTEVSTKSPAEGRKYSVVPM